MSLAALSVLYLVTACMHAAREKLWYDEVLTFDAATLLSSPGAFWAFLTRVEASPPLGFVLAAGSESIFGRNEFALRLPSVIAFWIMALCLYWFLSRRLPGVFAIAGMLLAVLTAAGRYSYEARPYAVMLACAGVALVAWQSAADGVRRRPALFALGAALAGALCAHSMAVTLAVPFLAGEIARTIQRKRVDWPVWFAFAAATPAVLVLWAIKSGRDFSAMSRFKGSVSHHIVTTYLQMLKPAAVPLALALLVVLALRVRGTGETRRTWGLRTYELAALVGFALIPFAAVPFSTLSGNYFLRYSLNCTMGLAGLLAVLLFRIGGTNRQAGVVVMTIFAAVFTVGQFLPEDRRWDAGLKALNASADIQASLERMPDDAPIVLCRGTTLVELDHYSDPRLAARLYYLTEPAVAAAIDGDILFEVGGSQLARYSPLRAHFEDYHAFIATHKRFYVVEPIRNIAREYFAGRIGLQYRETSNHFGYYEATVR